MNTKGTTMKSIALAVAVLASSALAQNVPQQVALTARLSNAGAPLTGSHTLLLKLFDTPNGGAEMWSESALATADNGLVALNLGAQSPLTPAILDGRALFVEVSVDGQVLAPRLPVVSVPYAVRSSIAASAATLGNLAPGDVALTAHTHAGTYLPVGATLTCMGTDKVVGLAANGSVICANDAGGTTYTAGSGISINGSSIAVSFAGTGTALTAARSDHNHAGTYLPLGAVQTCGGTNKMTGYNTNGSVLCAPDVDTNTTYAAGTGLSLSGTTFNLSYLSGQPFGSATTPARSDHGHIYNCPAGYDDHFFGGGSPEPTKILCTRAVAAAVTWPAAVRACAASGAGRLCTINEITVARSPTTFAHTQIPLLAGYWMADRLADDQAAVTNATSGDNFDLGQDPLTTASGYYCCTDGNFFR